MVWVYILLLKQVIFLEIIGINNKMNKKINFYNFSIDCEFLELCDCGKTEMCYNDKSETSECTEKDCPLLKKLKK